MFNLLQGARAAEKAAKAAVEAAKTTSKEAAMTVGADR